MRTSVSLTTTVLIVLAAGGVSAVGAAHAAGGAAAGTTRAAKIASAVSAAPRSVSQHATVKDYPTSPAAPAPVLRAGGAAWTCFPDDPTTPGPDPVCFDKQTEKWFEA